jgi:hypothetical protein
MLEPQPGNVVFLHFFEKTVTADSRRSRHLHRTGISLDALIAMVLMVDEMILSRR